MEFPEALMEIARHTNFHSEQQFLDVTEAIRDFFAEPEPLDDNVVKLNANPDETEEEQVQNPND